MTSKIISLLMIAIIAALIISGCVEKNTSLSDNTVGIPAKNVTVKIPVAVKSEAMPATVVVAPTLPPEQKIPASEKPKLTIASPETVSQGESFTATLTLEPRPGQKIVGIEATIASASGDKVSADGAEIISFNPEADKIIQNGIISYADTNGIAGDFAAIKFSAIKKGEAEIIVKATVVDENQFSAELVSKKIIKIV